MKLAKKMLVCLMALALVAFIGISASATSISVNGTQIEVGKEATISVTAADFAGAYSGNLTVKYDPAVVEYVGATSAVGIAGNPSAGEVTIAFMYMNAATDASATLAEITFKAIAAGDAAIEVVQDSWDGEGAAASVDTAASIGTVKVVEPEEKPTEEKPTEEKPTQEKPTEEKTTIPQPGDETTTEVIPPVDDDEIIVGPNDFVKGDAADKDAACEKAASAAKAAKAGKVAKVAQTGDTAVAVIAGIMAIGAVGFIATKKKEEI